MGAVLGMKKDLARSGSPRPILQDLPYAGQVRAAEGRGVGEGIGGNGDVRGPVQGAVPRMRHDGVCLTTVRLA